MNGPTRAWLVALPLVGLLAAVHAAGEPQAGRSLLAGTFKVTAAEFKRLDAGRVVARTLDVSHNREVATLGIVRIEATPDDYVRRLTDIATFKRDDAVLQIGTFSTVPVADDVAALTLEDADVKRLRDCRVGDCDIQLPAAAIERVRAHVDWRSPGAGQQATDVVRQLLVEYVAHYTRVGTSPAMEYSDTSAPLALGREFESLVAADTTTWRHVPKLRRHLLEFPAGRGDGAADLVYWSKERVRNRPVISVTHLAIVPRPGDPSVAYAIGSKQIYAMHYFDVSLGITLLIPEPGASPPATFVVYLNRSRIDLFDGFFGGMARKIVSGRARTLVGEQLGRLPVLLRSTSD